MRVASLLCLTLIACNQQADRTLGSLPPEARPDWRTYDGGTFTLRIPPDAVLKPDSSYPAGVPGLAIRGPTISVQSPNPNIGTHTGPAYKLIVSTFASPADDSVDQWVDSVRHAVNAQIGADDPDSLAYLRPPDTLRIAGLRVLRLHPGCGDCEPEEYYFRGPGQRVLISILYDLSIPGDPGQQRRFYNAVLDSFHWKQ